MLSVASWNLLSPTYAVKWTEPEGIHEDGTSNWTDVRWPRVQEILLSDADLLDVIFLQEIEPQVFSSDIEPAFSPHYRCFYAKHPSRADGLALLLNRRVFETAKIETAVEPFSSDGGAAGGQAGQAGVANLIVRVESNASTGESADNGESVPLPSRLSFVCTHQKGGREAQWAHLMGLIVAERRDYDAIVITAGDFNEDFEQDMLDCKLQKTYSESRSDVSSPANTPKHGGTSGTTNGADGSRAESKRKRRKDARDGIVSHEKFLRKERAQTEQDPLVLPLRTLRRDSKQKPEPGAIPPGAKARPVSETGARPMSIAGAAGAMPMSGIEGAPMSGVEAIPMSGMMNDVEEEEEPNIPCWTRWKIDQVAIKIDWIFVLAEDSPYDCGKKAKLSMSSAVRRKVLESYRMPRASDHCMDAMVIHFC